MQPAGKYFEVGYMPRHKQMPGVTYQIVSQDEHQAVIEYTYFCPYCMRKSIVRSAAHPPDYQRLENGGFFDILMCSECGQKAEVRFWKAMRIY